MLGVRKLGLVLTVIGVCLVVSGMVLFVARPEYDISENAFCGQSFCITKRPIYCYRALYGILFDSGWVLTAAGLIIAFLQRKWQGGVVRLCPVASSIILRRRTIFLR